MVSAVLGLCWRPKSRQALPLVTENSFMLREASSRGFICNHDESKVFCMRNWLGKRVLPARDTSRGGSLDTPYYTLNIQLFPHGTPSPRRAQAERSPSTARSTSLHEL